VDGSDSRQPCVRCLPLNIANSHGWEILSPCALSITRNGGIHARDITLKARDGYPDLSQVVVSHFAFGMQSVEPEILDLDDVPELKAQTMAWRSGATNSCRSSTRRMLRP
jgi:hypothetical protein